MQYFSLLLDVYDFPFISDYLVVQSDNSRRLPTNLPFSRSARTRVSFLQSILGNNGKARHVARERMDIRI